MTRQHNDECKTVLRLMGIPYIDVSVVIFSSMIAIQIILDRHQWQTLREIFGGRNFQHVCLRCLFKICKSFEHIAWYIKFIV